MYNPVWEEERYFYWCSFWSPLFIFSAVLPLTEGFFNSLAFPCSFIPYIQFSCRSVVSDSLRPHEMQHARPPCPSSTPRVHPNPCPLSQWCHQPSHPLLSPSPPALNLSQHQGLFQWVSSLHQVAKVLEFQLQHQSFRWTPRIDLL